MQFWKGQRVVFQGMLGTVYQDQGLDQTVKITLDHEKNVVESVLPRQIYMLTNVAETAYEYFVGRQYLP